MKSRRKILWKTGIGWALVFASLAAVGNPFVPDICTTRGYGFPLPVYIVWCECFIEDYPPAINISYIAFDLLCWGSVWMLMSAALIKRATRSRQIA
ncbi:MAG: hypothetical protein HY231_14150 [Acidobacteria bacterium]|nr:hypothetical protein [Acidobacteriota bacterium]